MRPMSFVLPAVSLCLMTAGVASARADAASDAKKAVEANFAKMAAAITKKDVNGYTQFLTDDFVNITKGGQRKNKQQEAATIGQAVQMAKSMKFRIKMTKFALQNGKALVTANVTGTLVLPNPQTKKDSTLVGDSVEEFVWVKSGSSWKIKQEKELSSKMTVDGKVLPGG